MKTELQRILETIPDDEPRSRLDPYRELILRMRRQGRTYHRIRQVLADKCKITVAYATLYDYIKRRSRPRKGEPQPASVTPPPEQLGIEQPTTLGSRARRTPEEIKAMREAASAANFKPVIPIEQDSKPYFDYDTSRPLTNKPSAKEK